MPVMPDAEFDIPYKIYGSAAVVNQYYFFGGEYVALAGTETRGAFRLL
jgi:hypothetical protein